MQEAAIEGTAAGRVARDEGWFILNLGEMAWRTVGFGTSCSFNARTTDPDEPGIGAHVHVLLPGEAPGRARKPRFAFPKLVRESRWMNLEDARAAGAFEPDLTLWDAWRPEQVSALLAGVQAPWYVAAGWAIELFLGQERREHEDLEIAVPRDRFGRIAERLSGFELFIPDGDLTDPGSSGHSLRHRRLSTGINRRGCGTQRRSAGGSTSFANLPTATSGSAAGMNGSDCRTPT